MARWIVGHYARITKFALQVFNRAKDLDYPKYEDLFVGRDVLSLCFVADPDPPSTAPAPIAYVRFDLEAAELVDLRHDCVGLVPLSDLWIGAERSVETARKIGLKIMRILLYCEPVAYELFIPVPACPNLDEVTPDPEGLETSFMITSPILRTGDRSPSAIQVAARPTDPTLESLNINALLDKWVDFYPAILQGSSYTALDMRSNWKAGFSKFVAFELERCTDRAASVHVCYKFRVGSFQVLTIPGLQGWLESLSSPPSGSQTSEIVSTMKQTMAEDKTALAENRAPLNVLIYTPADGSTPRSAWQALSSSLKPHERRSESWINALPPPEQFIHTYVEFGRWLGTWELQELDAPIMKRNAWGYFHPTSSR